MAELKTNIKDIPLANDSLYEEVARYNRTTKGRVQDIMEFVGAYTAAVIREGMMESVMLPYFGRFRPKPKKLQANKRSLERMKNGTDMLWRMAKGRWTIKDLRVKSLRTPTIIAPEHPETTESNSTEDETI